VSFPNTRMLAPVSFAGHDLCSSEPWIQTTSDPMPFHPTATGQEAIARAVTAKYSASNQSSTPNSTREKILDLYNRLRK
jgi:hypothetical protein